jgi:hypothetical protein
MKTIWTVDHLPFLSTAAARVHVGRGNASDLASTTTRLEPSNFPTRAPLLQPQHDACDFFGPSLASQAQPQQNCNYGGSTTKSAHLYGPRVRFKPYRPAASTCTSHHLRLHYATHITATDWASRWSYNRAAKWPGSHHGGRFPGETQSKRRWRRSA